MENIGQNIRAIRESKGMTLQQVALAAGYDAGNPSKLERGVVDWSGAALRALSAALGVEVRDFFLTQSEAQVLTQWNSLDLAEKNVLRRLVGVPEQTDEPAKNVKVEERSRGPVFAPQRLGANAHRLSLRYQPRAAGDSR